MKFHEVADIFPMMSPEEYESLKADIKQNGLLQPIWVYDDQIIDGRNRYNACLDLGIIPQYQSWDGNGSLVAFVVSLNLQRRHLNSSQKAFVALEVERLLAVEARERKSEAISVSNQENPRKQTKSTLGIFNDTTESEVSINQNFDSMKNDIALCKQKDKQGQPQASEQAAKLTGTNRCSMTPNRHRLIIDQELTKKPGNPTGSNQYEIKESGNTDNISNSSKRNESHGLTRKPGRQLGISLPQRKRKLIMTM